MKNEMPIDLTKLSKEALICEVLNLRAQLVRYQAIYGKMD